MRERLYIMRNQQGLTLVEALAALAITAFITGTAVLLLSQIDAAWRQSVHDYQDTAKVEQLLDRLGKDLEEAYGAAYLAYEESGERRHELHMWKGMPRGSEQSKFANYLVYQYRPDSRSVYLYTFTDGDSADSPGRPMNLQDSNVLLLADHITGLQYGLVRILPDGMKMEIPLTSGMELPPGAAVKVQLSAHDTKSNVRGPDTAYPEQHFLTWIRSMPTCLSIPAASVPTTLHCARSAPA